MCCESAEMVAALQLMVMPSLMTMKLPLSMIPSRCNGDDGKGEAVKMTFFPRDGSPNFSIDFGVCHHFFHFSLTATSCVHRSSSSSSRAQRRWLDSITIDQHSHRRIRRSSLVMLQRPRSRSSQRVDQPPLPLPPPRGLRMVASSCRIMLQERMQPSRCS